MDDNSVAEMVRPEQVFFSAAAVMTYEICGFRGRKLCNKLQRLEHYARRAVAPAMP